MYIHTEQPLTVKYGMAKRYNNVENEVEEHKSPWAGTPTCAECCATVSVLVDSHCSRTVGLSLDSLTISRKESIWGNRSGQH